jgi:hypothetical protein
MHTHTHTHTHTSTHTHRFTLGEHYGPGCAADSNWPKEGEGKVDGKEGEGKEGKEGEEGEVDEGEGKEGKEGEEGEVDEDEDDEDDEGDEGDEDDAMDDGAFDPGDEDNPVDTGVSTGRHKRNATKRTADDACAGQGGNKKAKKGATKRTGKKGGKKATTGKKGGKKATGKKGGKKGGETTEVAEAEGDVVGADWAVHSTTDALTKSKHTFAEGDGLPRLVIFDDGVPGFRAAKAAVAKHFKTNGGGATFINPVYLSLTSYEVTHTQTHTHTHKQTHKRAHTHSHTQTQPHTHTGLDFTDSIHQRRSPSAASHHPLQQTNFR